jgi:hypothetical protein
MRHAHGVSLTTCDALRQLGCGRWMWRSMKAIIFVKKVILVSSPPANQNQKT